MRVRRAGRAGIFAVIAATAMLLTGCGEASPSTDGEDSVQEVEVAGDSGTATFADSVYTSSLVRIEITDSQVILLGEAGNEYGDGPVLALWYDTTNVSGQTTDPLTAWLTHFRVFQEDGDGQATELTLAMAPDARLLTTQTHPIEAGVTVSNAVAYRLQDESATVRVVALDTGLNEVGSQDRPLG